MTIDKAGRRRAAWKSKQGAKTCQHMNLINVLTVKNKKIRDYFVCVECGEVYIDPKKLRSSDNVKSLEELAAEYA